jgi:hypothetical protein
LKKMEKTENCIEFLGFLPRPFPLEMTRLCNTKFSSLSPSPRLSKSD